MKWIGFDIAALHVRRRLDLSVLAAVRVLNEACEKDEVASKWDEDVLLVFDVDLEDWLKAKQRRQPAGKQPRILRFLDKKFPDQKVPPPGEYPRKQLIGEFLKAYPKDKTCDEDTMAKAIRTKNSRR